ncbi:MAG: hypothetical protein MZV70_20210 [Desulfobacterales bacterium]|nr:hypothetical protein [Desulfobacterales bacterium]
MRLFENQTAQDCGRPERAPTRSSAAQAAAIRSRRLFYNTADGSARLRRRCPDDRPRPAAGPGARRFGWTWRAFRLRGPHNVENACAAALAALAAGASPVRHPAGPQRLRAPAPPHRIRGGSSTASST